MKEIILEQKNQNGDVLDTFTVKNGPAYYVMLGWIPLVGWLILLIMSIIRKQCRGIFLNRLLFVFIIALITSLFLDYDASVLVTSIAMIALDIYYVVKANYLTMAQKVSLGYEIKDGEIYNDMELRDLEEKIALTKNHFSKYYHFNIKKNPSRILLFCKI